MLLTAIVGYSWLSWNYNNYSPANAHSGIDLCLFRRVTGLPCPSCGTTRSVLSLSHMQFTDALHYNPLGFIMALALCILPLWVVVDTIGRKNSFHQFYLNTEKFVRNRWVAIMLISLMLGNWIWNIYKYTS